jgi:hypothetical protein
MLNDKIKKKISIKKSINEIGKGIIQNSLCAQAFKTKTKHTSLLAQTRKSRHFFFFIYPLKNYKRSQHHIASMN